MNIVQIAQHADDLDRAVAFYEDLLGQKVAARFDPPGIAFFLLGGTRLLLDRAAPTSLVYLAVDDVNASVDALRARGGGGRVRAAHHLPARRRHTRPRG